MAAFGPAAAALFAHVAAYAQCRQDTAHFSGATLQHDSAPGAFPRHLVLSARFSDGGTATFAMSPHIKGAATGTVHFHAGTDSANTELLVKMVTQASLKRQYHPDASDRGYNAIRDVFVRALA